jgi:citrate synthase
MKGLPGIWGLGQLLRVIVRESGPLFSVLVIFLMVLFLASVMVYLLACGELPHPDAGRLLEAALVAAVDHGPQAPSIAAARMAITCGVGINNAMASATNMLGDVHGGAGEQCVQFYNAIAERVGEIPLNGRLLNEAVRV